MQIYLANHSTAKFSLLKFVTGICGKPQKTRLRLSFLGQKSKFSFVTIKRAIIPREKTALLGVPDSVQVGSTSNGSRFDSGHLHYGSFKNKNL